MRQENQIDSGGDIVFAQLPEEIRDDKRFEGISPLAFMMWVYALLGAVGRKSRDGKVHASYVVMCGNSTNRSRAKKVLISRGLWVQTEGEVFIANYETYFPTRIAGFNHEREGRNAETTSEQPIGQDESFFINSEAKNGFGTLAEKGDWRGERGEGRKHTSSANADAVCRKRARVPERMRDQDVGEGVNPALLHHVGDESLSPTSAALLAELRKHPSLACIATARHAERQSAFVDGGTKRLEWLLDSIRSLARHASSQEDCGQPLTETHLADKLGRYCAKSEPRSAREQATELPSYWLPAEVTYPTRDN